MTQKTDSKRENGQFYTLKNPFHLTPFTRWAEQIKLREARILEPFAGKNDIINHLTALNLCKSFRSYDIAPNHDAVRQLDTIANFPAGYDVCVTNPPWLARNSATRRGLSLPTDEYDDLYKHCLKLCLDNCRFVAALLPASYLQSGLFQDRLKTYILLHDVIFGDTKNPTCLSLFGDKPTKSVAVYYDNECVGDLAKLRDNLPRIKSDKRVRFNDPNGNLGFISFDNTKEPSIRFCHAEEINNYDIKTSSRFITRISGDWGDVVSLVKKLNRKLNTFRQDTYDIFLTPFKGMREDGCYRRRMDYKLAKRFINAVC